ncbi:MAG: PD-(D/E)XK nuclease family protein [Deltaproteobacteria bacterium]|nr:PD-(D/E)XK nuclease family protein [Deltaproteobacteria bacterium]
MIFINQPTKTNPSTEPHKRPENAKRWLSPSSINGYLYCPRRFYYSKILKLKQRPSIHLIRGIAVHSTIYKFYKHKINRCKNMEYGHLIETMTNLLKHEWMAWKKSLLELDLKGDEMAFYFHDTKKMIINFIHDFLKGRQFEASEPTLEKTFFSKKFRTLGRIDAIHHNHDSPLLVDYKTSKSKELIPEYKRQLAIYALLYKEKTGILPIVGIHFLKFKDGLKKYRITPHYLAKMEKLITDIHTKTQSERIEDYPCTCGWCHKNFELKTAKR